MDIHRCRFVPYPLSAINSIAFSHESTPDKEGKGPPNLRLAIGRANGDIEIWNPLKEHWFQESILKGSKDRSIEGLVWTQDPDEEVDGIHKSVGKLRLFSIGYSTAITEWDLALGHPIRHSSGNYGDIWCLAGQAKWKEKRSHQHLIAGCADGTLVVHSTADNDLRFLRTLTRSSKKRARVLCVTFQTHGVIVAGYADSTIRVYSFRTGVQIGNMSLGSGPRGGPSEILVWTVMCLPDGTIVSGDSTGEVKFWDGKTKTLLQRIQSHRSDILDLVTNADGTIIFSGGMDRRTTMYRQTSNSFRKALSRWAEVEHKRIHSHDIKAMATFETKEMSVFASGGLDTSPIIFPLQQFKSGHHRSLPILPQLPPLQSAPRKRLVMSWWAREVRVWRIARLPPIGRSDDDHSVIEGPIANKLVSRIMVQGEENLTSADLSFNGALLAAATISEIKVFRLKDSKSTNERALKVQKMELPQDLAENGARIVQFSPDSKWLLVIRMDNAACLYRIAESQVVKAGLRLLDKPAILRRVHKVLIEEEEGNRFEAHGDYGNTITRIAFSADSRILVVADLSGILDSWVLEGYEDLTQTDDSVVEERPQRPSYDSDDEDTDEESHPHVILGQHWIRNPAADVLPKLPSTPLILCFRPVKPSTAAALTNGYPSVHPTRHNPHPHSHDLPNGEDRLIVVTAHNHIYEYEILAGKLSSWSKRNPPSRLPAEFRELRDRAMGSLWDINDGRERLWLYGTMWLFMIDLSRDFQTPEYRDVSDDVLKVNGTSANATVNKKRKRQHGRDPEETRPTKKREMGTGTQVATHNLDLGISRTSEQPNGPDQDHAQPISLEVGMTATDEEDDASSEDDETGLAMTLVNLKRSGKEIQSNGPDEEFPDTDGAPTSGADPARNRTTGPVHWHTLTYRPILGVVLLGGEDEDEGRGREKSGEHDESRRGIEVALVERPLWDEDLPARFHGDQEWNY